MCELIMSLSFGACKDHVHANSVSKSNKTAKRNCKNAIFTQFISHRISIIREIPLL